MKWFLIFWLGFVIGKLDAKYGYEYGIKTGKYIKSIFIKEQGK